MNNRSESLHYRGKGKAIVIYTEHGKSLSLPVTNEKPTAWLMSAVEIRKADGCEDRETVEKANVYLQWRK